MDKKHKILLRFAAIFFAIAAGFLCVLIQIVNLQFRERQQWLDLAKYQEPIKKAVAPMRGNIYDAEGRLLAGSMPKYVLAMDMRTKALHQGGDTLFYNNLDSICTGLSTIFRDKTPQEYRQMLTAAYRRQDFWCKLQPKPVTFSQMKRVKALPLFRKGVMKSGLHCEESHQRVKPFGTLASRSIGSVDPETDSGRTGLESSYNEYLCGTPGVSQREKVQGHYEDITIKSAINGLDIVTTIDANLQDLAESLLRQRLEMTQGSWGCIILMETKTGEIKAISNLDRLENGNYTEMEQHALQRVEPGSMFKTLSLMTALEDGVVDYEKDTFHVYKGGWKYNGLTNTDAHQMDTVLNVRDAMAVSSNIALAKMITRGYKDNAEKFVESLHDMGFADSVPSDILGAQNPVIRAPKNDNATLAPMSYGYSVELSPLNIVTIYNAIANNGKMVAPVLVKEIREDGRTVKTFKTHTLKQHICSDRTLRQIRECLHAVVWDNKLGTAAPNKWGQKKAQSNLVALAGKTGTAQILERGVGYSSHHHRIAFVGYFPEEDPQYSVICMIHHPHNYGLYDAGMDCGTVARHLAERVMAYAGTKDVSSLKLPYDSINLPAVKAGHQEYGYEAVRGSGLRIQREKEYDWTRIATGMEQSPVEVNKQSVPNVVGMGARDAVYAIEQTGMRVQLTGKGRVVSQSVSAGSQIVKGGTVYLELR